MHRVVHRFLSSVLLPIRDMLLKVGLLRHRHRQPYRLGFLSPHYTTDDLRRYLNDKGYRDNLIAWKDPGEILNMRKVINRHYQYHLRVFRNREVKGHFECSPERHPIAHMSELAMLPCRDYFVPLLADWIEPTAPERSGNTIRQT